jgi:exopolysaccharide biosynthesis polyprenyl glycosylphosphotransferase
LVAPKAVLGPVEPESVAAQQLLAPWHAPTTLWSLISRAWFKQILFLAGDLAAVWLSYGVAELLTRRYLRVPPSFLSPFHYYLFYIPFFAAVVYLFQGYKNPDLRRPEKELETTCEAVSFFFVALVCANFVLFKAHGFSRYLVVEWYVFSLLSVLTWRFAVRAGYSRLWRRGLARERTLLAGPLEQLGALQSKLAAQRHARHEIVGVLADSAFPCDFEPAKCSLPVLGRLEEWEQIAGRYAVRWLLLSCPCDEFRPDSDLFELIRRCHERGIEVEVHSRLFSCSEFRYERDDFSGLFRFYAAPGWSRPAQKVLKLGLDLVIGAVGSLLTLLLTPVIAALLKWQDGGPVFYRSEFVNRAGEVDYYLKFRTMVSHADQILRADAGLKQKFDEKFKLEQDPRVLPVGRWLRKYSLDEFPQFFSLLSGKLTFVGPRTVRAEELARYGRFQAKLLSTKPGMTGYWQVMGRQTTTYEERVEMDMFYIDHWSLWLDLIIMAKTLRRVIGGEGAY